MFRNKPATRRKIVFFAIVSSSLLLVAFVKWLLPWFVDSLDFNTTSDWFVFLTELFGKSYLIDVALYALSVVLVIVLFQLGFFRSKVRVRIALRVLAVLIIMVPVFISLIVDGTPIPSLALMIVYLRELSNSAVLATIFIVIPMAVIDVVRERDS